VGEVARGKIEPWSDDNLKEPGTGSVMKFSAGILHSVKKQDSDG
jgi:hypothetical protein